MEEVMKRQIRNAITSFVVTAFAGIGLMAFGQTPTQTCPVQTTQPVVIQQTVEQTCPQQPTVQPTVIQTVQDFVVQQPQAPAAAPIACADLCELIKDIEKTADHLRSEFKDSVRCLECADDSYYDSVKEFERATDRLKKNYRRSDCNACDIAGDVQEVLALANCISAYMDPCSHCPEVIEEWTALQGDLQQLAGQFCTTASFQQPVSLACPVPCVQPTCPAPAPVVSCPAPAPVVSCPAPVAQPVCPTGGSVIYK
jgi:hypothetical protein